MTTTAPTHGFICKRCGDVAPEGVGYATKEPAAIERSRTTRACACGYSQRATAPLLPAGTLVTVRRVDGSRPAGDFEVAGLARNGCYVLRDVTHGFTVHAYYEDVRPRA